ncbi:hypothetical protein CRG98_023883 [Punica granatum]|uniref:HVA22-like protein n=1 Tax=Punica granatum TaxID=22663 RepID=A0A2I0JHD5_PUNGR|nr:hypothetical protein CRG98_023883 [Punica granatum]
MGALGTIARSFDALIGPGVMLLFPLYASMRAIESPSTLDDQQWLTYWNVVRKYIKIGGYVGSNYSDSQKRVLQMMSLDARKSVESFIERYGPDAFDRVVKAFFH